MGDEPYGDPSTRVIGLSEIMEMSLVYLKLEHECSHVQYMIRAKQRT
jgi:hypothetical protein